MNSLQEQIGGTHYKSMPYQPVEFCTDMNMNFIQGSIIKYISRYKNKNGKEDLLKAKHFAKLGSKLSPKNNVNKHEIIKHAEDYCEKNGLPEIIKKTVYSVFVQDWIGIILNIGIIIRDEYEQSC